ncbi:hypothetical protein TSTA_084480 [Talaromyces stipitatus ATCC 10500]|uniref:Uncharacterized protein n=1 Tax=Talaromyces stipitatus (strain ATCC 10500 / CBS 375.48 / QM 6759 / NRRL 1006) TaxID=441959 RepID=B8M0C0_TALSN|nr:uncharacterized protein TSTA_084480 [Talaromyces stipitatus ATCC 10500]EED21217.1 hypothetical protein TSTA_084480 [Talaromyces stipitatus ATCC 10500]
MDYARYPFEYFLNPMAAGGFESSFAQSNSTWLPHSSTQVHDQDPRPASPIQFAIEPWQEYYETSVGTDINEDVFDAQAIIKAFTSMVLNLVQMVQTSNLRLAVRALKQLSTILIHNANLLGLFEDHPNDPCKRQQNRDLWITFNICWLTTFQKQKESSQENQILDADEMEDMGDFLIHLCDGLEGYGLVDYEMGVWEEEILDSTMRAIPPPMPIDTNKITSHWPMP